MLLHVTHVTHIASVFRNSTSPRSTELSMLELPILSVYNSIDSLFGPFGYWLIGTMYLANCGHESESRAQTLNKLRIVRSHVPYNIPYTDIPGNYIDKQKPESGPQTVS